MVALATSRPLAAMPKKHPLGDCRMILPRCQYIRNKVSASSWCPSAITVLWRLWREDREQRREARTQNLSFLLSIFILDPLFHIPPSSFFFYSPRVRLCLQMLFGKHVVTSALPLLQSVLYPIWTETNLGPDSKIISKWIIVINVKAKL